MFSAQRRHCHRVTKLEKLRIEIFKLQIFRKANIYGIDNLTQTHSAE